MLCPILCSCGRSLDDLYKAFLLIKNKKIADYLQKHNRNIRPEMLSLVDVDIDFGDELNDLGLHTMCCRHKIMTVVKFTDLY